ncbi:DUF3987 domain-containing protein [Reyranella sp. CPCC 100927]|uniref:DUF3987 domain-containing protein n=1 Tax=Reyranella sp. CPCC 100927 TaxID=2599616 RepID=UPI0011B36460|nr:DUF3987 domain-containing protein [Reyranella sp. CPCC 100927]TWS97554.1 DUF3987 domain-containing protein [Reyranella sp. CPCC 100927]
MSARDFASLTHANHGKPLRWWRYTDAFAVADLHHHQGRTIGAVAVNNGTSCYWHEPLPPWPLYRVPALQARRDAPVLVVESEAAAEAAGALFADHVCVTWPGGSNAVDKADLAPLRGRAVVLWPDHDGAGVTAMERLQVRLRGIACTVALVVVPRGWPDRWTLAHTLPAGVTVETLRGLLREASRAPDNPGVVEAPCTLRPAADDNPRPQGEVGALCDSPVGAADDHDPEAVEKTPEALSSEDDVPVQMNAIAAPAVVSDWPAPDFAMLDDDPVGDLPAFPVDVLPPFWRHWSRGAAREANAPVDLVALSLLTTAAGLIGGARRIAPVPSWSEPCVLWTALVGAPACGKTAALETSLRLVRALDRDLADVNAAQQRRHVTARAVARAEEWWWRDGVRGAVANRRAAPEIPAIAQETEAFAPRRLIADDPALGAMCAALRGNPRGVLLVRDPLADWLNDNARGADNSFWQASWSGNACSIAARRACVVSLDCTAVSILGTIRPEAITAALARRDADAAARLLFAWPPRAAFEPLPDMMAVDDQMALAALGALRDLPEAVRVLPLTPDARMAFDRFRRRHHDQAGRLEGCEADWWSRGAGSVLRLAGVLMFLAWSQERIMPEPTQVALWAMRAAIGLWLEYLWPHARGVFQLAGGSVQERQARRALRWLQHHGKAEVSRTELRRSALGRTCDAAETGRVAEALVMGGWLRPVSAITRGRPPVRWTVNDALHATRGL